jgi:hypothetical protein
MLAIYRHHIRRGMLFRKRPAYRYAIKHSIYVHREHFGRGVGPSGDRRCLGEPWLRGDHRPLADLQCPQARTRSLRFMMRHVLLREKYDC